MQEPKDMIFEQDETNGFRVSLCPTESSKNGNGAVHGGVIFLLCEETMARYIKEVPPQKQIFTITVLHGSERR